MRVLLSVLLALLVATVSSTMSLAVSPAAALDAPTGRWPLEPEPEVVRGFEPPPSPYASGHRGVDLAGAPRHAVLAALPGTVGFAGSIGGKPVVTVLHGGRRTTYEPVVASVEPGQQVAAGDVLGRLTVTDSHCFPAACLHWGLIEGTGDDEVYVDPLSLVGGGPVRLLPLWRDEPVTVRQPWTPLRERWRRPLDWLPARLAGLRRGGARAWERTTVEPDDGPTVVPLHCRRHCQRRPPFMPSDAPAGRPCAAGRS